jgi:RecB family exonuclease
MGLRLYYVESVAPFFDEILQNLIFPHFDFKLRDSFRILCPDAPTVQDIERAILDHSISGGVLIGRSLSTLDQFARDLTETHPAPRPIAGPAAMAKALRLSLKQKGVYRPLDFSTERQYLAEFHRINHLFRIRACSATSALPIPPLMASWEKIISQEWGLWNSEQIFNEACGMLGSGKLPSLHGLRELFFLGFTQVDGYLTETIRALHQGFPQITLHLFLPPPETGTDPQGWLAPLYAHLEKISASTQHYQKLPLPALQGISYPTPLHEANATAHDLQNSTDSALSFHGNGTSASYLRDLLAQQGDPLHRHLPAIINPSVVPGDLLQSIPAEQDGDEEIYFKQLHGELLPLFVGKRQELAGQGQAAALGHLERAYGILLEKGRWESYQEELRPRREWTAELGEEFREILLQETDPWSQVLPLRSYAQPGLRQADALFLTELNEGIFPRTRGFPLFPVLASDPLKEHEGYLKLKAILYLARRSARLSFFEQDMEGRIQRPSPLWESFLELPSKPVSEPPPLRASGHHPYFSENARREARRLRDPRGALDRGELRGLALRPLLEKQFLARPLSASYVDDYAKCPWKFFAARHLKLRETVEPILEIEPKAKGRFSHALLERVYRELIPTSFSQGRVPGPEALEQALGDSLKICLEQWQDALEVKNLPTRLWREEVQRICSRVRRFLQMERETWQEANLLLFPHQLEWRFGKKPLPEVRFPLRGGAQVPLSGAVDRIDYNAKTAEYLLLDYKAGSGEELARQLREGLSYQLYIYLYAVRQALFPQGRALGGLYGDLKKSKKNQGIARRESLEAFRLARGNNKSFLSDEDFASLQEKLSVEFEEILQNILNGAYPLEPKECQGERCPYHEICRYDRQPR